MNSDEMYEKAKTIQEIITPKLYAFQNNGNGDTIHTTNTFIGYMKGAVSLLDWYKKQGDIEKYDYWCKEFYDRVTKAETWMIEYAKRL